MQRTDAAYIEELLRENTYGNPMAVISYTSLSQREIARRITEGKGIAISQNVAANALEALGYSKQKNQKMEQVGTAHPDRDAQRTRRGLLARGRAVCVRGLQREGKHREFSKQRAGISPQKGRPESLRP